MLKVFMVFVLAVVVTVGQVLTQVVLNHFIATPVPPGTMGYGVGVEFFACLSICVLINIFCTFEWRV